MNQRITHSVFDLLSQFNVTQLSVCRSPTIVIRKTKTLLRLGSCLLASDSLTRRLVRLGDPLVAHAYVQSYLVLGRHTQAERLLTRLLLKNPNQPTLVIELAKIYQQSGRINEALKLLAHAAKKRPDDPDLALMTGRILTATCHYELALAYYNHPNLAGAKRPELHYARGRLLRLIGKVVEADKELTEAQRLAPTDEQVLSEAAKVKIALGNYPEAEVIIGKLLDKNQDNSDAWLDLARIMLARGDDRQAQNALTQYERIAGRTNELLYESVQVHLKLKQYEPALQLLTQLKPESHPQLELWRLTIRCQLALGLLEQAITSLNQALAIEPDHELLLVKLVLLGSPSRNHSATVVLDLLASDYESWPQSDPTIVSVIEPATLQKFIESCDREHAQDVIDALMLCSGTHPAIAQFLAKALDLQGKPREAVAILESVTHEIVSQSPIGLELVRLYLKTGRLEAAERLLDQLEATGTTQELQLERARLAYENADYPKALNILEQIIYVKQLFYPVALLMGKNFSALGDLDHARHWLNTALSLKSEAVEARIELIRLAINARDYTRAEELVSYFKAWPEPPAEVVLETIRLKLETGEVDVAAAELDRVLAAYPDEPGCLFLQARLATKQGYVSKACNAYRSGLTLNPRNQAEFIAFIELLINNRLFEDAKQVIDWAQREGHTGILLFLEQAKLLRRLGEFQAAQQVLNQIESFLASTPADAAEHEDPTHRLTGTRSAAQAEVLAFELERLRLSMDMGNLARAQELLTSTLQNFPDAPAPCFLQAQIALKRGELKAATLAYRAGLKLAPQNSTEFISYIRLLLDQQSYDGAIEALTWAEREGHTGIQFILERARLQREKGETTEARETVNQALALDPHGCMVHLEHGRLLRQTGEIDAAIIEFEAASNAPDIEQAEPLDRAQILRESQQPLKALACLDSAKISQGSSSHLELETALCFLDLGDWEAALSAYQKALTLGPCSLLTAHRNQFDLLDQYSLSSLELQKLDSSGTPSKVTFKPVTLTVMLTHRCNLRCIMCGSFRKRAPDLPLAALKKLDPLLPNIRTINWLGGEIFLVDYFYEYLKELHRRFPRLNHTVTTNGLLVDDRWAALFAAMNVEVCFSIDSVVPETYESIRRPASFARLTSRLSSVAEAYRTRGVQPNFSVFALLMRRTMKELPLMPEFCKRYGIKRIHVAYLRPERVPDEDVLQPGDRQTTKTALEYLRATELRCAELGITFECGFLGVLERSTDVPEGERTKGETPNLRVTPQAPESLVLHPTNSITMQPRREDAVVDSALDLPKTSKTPCVYPWTTLFVESDGWVKPHCDCSVPIGNLITQDLDQILQGRLLKIYQHRLRNGQTKGWCNEQCVCLKNAEAK